MKRSRSNATLARFQRTKKNIKESLSLKKSNRNRYIDDIFSLWDISKPDIETYIEQANSHHPTIKFTAEISDTETVFLDTVIQRRQI